MSPARWQRVKQVFHEAAVLDCDGRAGFLDQACDGDLDLRSEVESLLASDADPMQLLDRPIFETPADGSSSPIGRRFGPYRSRQELGRGGMGTVYLATREDEQFQQRVAVKLLKRGMDSDEILRRFHQERQIVASLDHPNIAKLLDGGITHDGQPYFIMEYVDGMPIDRFCRRHALSLSQRIELFRRICSAVQHAHSNLVVHRDIKPSNILVTADGVPKLLDFGVAKLLRSDPMPRLITTDAGLCPMTPEYASPEQVRGEPITTASDIYSLGVLLYRLLTGVQPYEFDSRRLRDIESVVSEREPKKPSLAAAEQASEDPLGLTGSDAFRRRLRGDLDNIILKALSKEPARRYGSAEQLSDDLRRQAAGLPVVASGDRLPYLMNKFVRRHKATVAGVGLILLSLVAGILTTSRQARIARAQQARADQVSDFLVELFRLADPYKITDGAVSARRLLDAGEQEIRRELQDRPDLLAQLMDTMGRAYVNLGLYQEAMPLLEDSLALRRRVFGPRSPETAESLGRLGSLRRLLGDYRSAEQLLGESLDVRRKLFGEPSAEVADGLDNLGALSRLQGQYPSAEDYYRRALAQRRQLWGEDHPRVARSLSNLALALRDMGDYQEAESLYRQALAVSRRTLGEQHADVAIYLHNLGELLSSMGQYDDAEPLLRDALRLNTELLSDQHPAVATSSSALALLLRKRGDDDAAEPLLRRALSLRRQLFGNEHRSVANSINLLGALLRDRGELTASRELLDEALYLRRKTLGHEHLAVAYSLVDLARLHLAQSQPELATELLSEALGIQRRRLREDHWRIAVGESLLGESLTQLHRFDEAEPLLVSSLDQLADIFGADHPHALEASRRVATFERMQAQPDRD